VTDEQRFFELWLERRWKAATRNPNGFVVFDPHTWVEFTLADFNSARELISYWRRWVAGDGRQKNSSTSLAAPATRKDGAA
jgi:hypothetical protein